MIIVADSGSTKTEWITERLSVTTKGINPVRDSYEEILSIITDKRVALIVKWLLGHPHLEWMFYSLTSAPHMSFSFRFWMKEWRRWRMMSCL